MSEHPLLRLAPVAATVLGACTTLGPMPATTGMIGAASGRPDVEAQAGIMPGYYLSDTTQDHATGRPAGQLSGMVEPGRLIGVPGLGVGARHVGGGDDVGYVEPMVRYRGHLDGEQRFTGVAVVYGTHASSSHDKADYSATRGGVELGEDTRLTPVSRWVEAHLFASASLTGLDAKGHYCLDAAGRYGVDCGDRGVPVTAAAGGFYPAGTVGVAVDFGKHLDSVFHGGRLALMGAAGTQPHVEAGDQRPARAYVSAGVTLTLGAGAL